MFIRLMRFNIYLLGLLLLLALTGGCKTKTPEERKQEKMQSCIRIYREVYADPAGNYDTVTVFRSNPMHFTVSKIPEITEAEVEAARIVEDHGTFAIQVKFKQRGTWLLEQTSAMTKGHHLVILCTFGEKLAKSRWMAAPYITTRISDGVLTFTPDADRAEADEIVLGLNNVAGQTSHVMGGAEADAKKEKEAKEMQKQQGKPPQ